ncbi:NAD-dependent protein deacylase [Planctomycetes bacterium Poly30]|uniref:NAD-dependent protein deacylase n=1 Tax=Saltatorellus ferox TaxID=2528018 RepID=A0A518ES66_9BACT|nr:NAD-dependent protein deacylase [Planctomycetes bacterium Poly30]
MTQHVVVLTGAGISADSGVDTYRDSGGLWEGHRFEEVATPEGWAADRALVWRFYQLRRAQMATVEPNAAHHALVKLAEGLKAEGGSLTLVTQNVDDLHQRAGSEVLAMHGQLSQLLCEACDEVTEDTEHLEVDVFVGCPACGHTPLRPNVVWFSEVPHYLDEIERAVARATTFVAIGTSGAVYPAAAYLAYARANGAKTIVQGLAEPDNLAEKDEFLCGRASEVVPTLVDRLLMNHSG